MCWKILEILGNSGRGMGNVLENHGNPKKFWEKNGKSEIMGKSWNNHRTIEFFKYHLFGKAFLSWLYRWKSRVEQTGEVVHHHLSGRAFTPSKSYSFASRDPEMFRPELNLAMFCFNGVY